MSKEIIRKDNIPKELERYRHIIDTLKDNIPEEYLDFDLYELYTIENRTNAKDIKKLIQIMVYIDCRFNSKMSKVEAFKIAFPERCVVSDESKRGRYVTHNIDDAGKYEYDKKVGEPLSNITIKLKANRLENSVLFKSIYAIIHSSLYIAYAIDRIRVLDRALQKSMSDDVADRDQVQYMKLFLEETRKPNEVEAGNMIANIQINNTNIETIENKLSDIADKLSNMSADKIIDVISENK